MSVDVPVLGRRLGEMRNNFSLPTDLTFPNILSDGAAEFGDVEKKEKGALAFGVYLLSTLASRLAYVGIDDTLEWKEVVPWLKKEAEGMEIWLKGGAYIRAC